MSIHSSSSKAEKRHAVTESPSRRDDVQTEFVMHSGVGRSVFLPKGQEMLNNYLAGKQNPSHGIKNRFEKTALKALLPDEFHGAICG